jgi:hypothetical protein
MALAKQQESMSPWAYIAFESDGPKLEWEPFEPEVRPQEFFAPLERDSAGNQLGHPQPGPDVVDSVPMEVTQVFSTQEDRHGSSIAEYERRLQELEESHQAALAQLEQTYATGMLQRVTAQLEEMGGKLAQETGDQLARLLAPLLRDHARKASMAALTRDLQRILSSNDVTKLRMSGPQLLIKKVQESLGESASRIDMLETDTIDVTVEIDGEILATKLSGWAATLNEVVA